MESEVFEKCGLNQYVLEVSHTLLPISQIRTKTQNSKSTAGELYKASNNGSHQLLASYVSAFLECAKMYFQDFHY